ncbi:MAG: hypothetical protein IJP33_03400, partial [Firmicutes bacterium]|nr:hypothetical protein [Bacillota bacterium]
DLQKRKACPLLPKLSHSASFSSLLHSLSRPFYKNIYIFTIRAVADLCSLILRVGKRRNCLPKKFKEQWLLWRHIMQ